MKTRSCFGLVLAFALLFSNAVLFSQTNTIVVPREALQGFGDSFANLFPSQDGNPVQQVYSAGEFAEIPADSIWITGIGLRLDGPEASIDGTVETRLTMGVFEGSMDDLTVYMEESLQNPQVVLFRTNFHLFAEAPNGPTEFNLRIRFDNPFLYDRRSGQLVLRFEAGLPTAGGGFSNDALRVAPDRGLYIIRFNDGMPGAAYELIATQFFYTVPPKIEVIRKLENVVQIDFVFPGPPEGVGVEKSPVADGPYTVEEQVELSVLLNDRWRASLPMSGTSLFFRIALE